MTNACERLAHDLGGLYSCEEGPQGIRIRTPFLYPDGDLIDLYLKENRSGSSTLSDLGETVRWLRMQTLSPRRSPKQTAMIQDAALNHGVEFFRGMLQARVHDSTELAQVVTRLAQAALRVSDIWFTFRTRAIESVTDEIATFLEESEIGFERGPRIPGRSGRIWTPDFHTRTPARSSLVYLLSSGSRSAARAIANTVHTAWYDLSHLEVGPEGLKFVSLFDDTADVWGEEDFRLLEALSSVARWSAPDEFRTLLSGA